MLMMYIIRAIKNLNISCHILSKRTRELGWAEFLFQLLFGGHADYFKLYLKKVLTIIKCNFK
jgi:hypothetical protein